MNRRFALAALLAAGLAGRSGAQGAGPTRVVAYLVQGPGRPRNFTRRMAELGYVDGRNLRIAVVNVSDVITAAAIEKAVAETLATKPEVIVAGGAAYVVALHRATSSIPIVSAGVSNPITIGVARSLRQPGMNVTGLSYGLEEGAVLQMGALRVMRPQLKRVVFMLAHDDHNPAVVPEHVSAASALGVEVTTTTVANLGEAERALDAMRDPASEAIWVDVLPPALPMKALAAAAIRRRIVSHARTREGVRNGLLFSYWPQHADPALRIASTVNKILRGADPAGIPFEQPDSTTLVLNRATAAALRLAIPDSFQLRVTEMFD